MINKILVFRRYKKRTTRDHRHIVIQGTKVRIWKRFRLEDAKEALRSLFAKERDGRILLDIG
ncbi:MAG TPA: hypothetical protein VJ729_17010 [Nitrososphaeraceae archaeon]|nr:hypothetical protein [Nitrososphaeraceae archaeon]